MVRTGVGLIFGGHSQAADNPRDMRAVAVPGAIERVAVRLRFVSHPVVVFPGKIPAIDFGRGERVGLYLTGVISFIGASSASSTEHRVGVVDPRVDHRDPDSFAVEPCLPCAPGGLCADGRDAFLGEQPVCPRPLDPLYVGELGQSRDGRRGNAHP